MSLVTGVTKDYQGDVDFDPNSLSTVANEDVALYVDSVNGSDANPGTQPRPFKTIDFAISKLPPAWRKSCRIFTAAGDYDFKGNSNYQFGHGLGAKASPLMFVGAAQVLPGLGNLTSDPATGSPVSQAYVAPVATVNGALRGAILQNNTTGRRQRIVDNVFAAGKTTFYLQFAIATAPVNNFDIIKPACNYRPTSPSPFVFLNSYVGLSLVRIVSPVEFGFESPLFGLVNNSICAMYDCEMDGGTSNRDFFMATGSRMVASSEQNAWLNDVNKVPFLAGSRGGLWYHCATPPGSLNSISYQCSMIGNYMLDNTVLLAYAASAVEIFAINGNNLSILVLANSQLELDGGDPTEIGNNLIQGSSPIVGDTVSVAEDSNASIADLDVGGQTLTINASLGNALNVQNSAAKVGDLRGGGVGPNQNAGFGIVSNLSKVVRYLINPTVVGAAGETKVGTVPTLYAGLPFTDAPTLSTIQ